MESEYETVFLFKWIPRTRTTKYNSQGSQLTIFSIDLQIASDNLLTTDYRRFYRWTAQDDQESTEKHEYPTMVMEVFGKSESDEYDFEFRSDDYVQQGAGKINGKWMSIVVDSVYRESRITKTTNYMMENKNSLSKQKIYEY